MAKFLLKEFEGLISIRFITNTVERARRCLKMHCNISFGLKKYLKAAYFLGLCGF